MYFCNHREWWEPCSNVAWQSKKNQPSPIRLLTSRKIIKMVGKISWVHPSRRPTPVSQIEATSSSSRVQNETTIIVWSSRGAKTVPTQISSWALWSVTWRAQASVAVAHTISLGMTFIYCAKGATSRMAELSLWFIESKKNQQLKQPWRIQSADETERD